LNSSERPQHPENVRSIFGIVCSDRRPWVSGHMKLRTSQLRKDKILCALFFLIRQSWNGIHPASAAAVRFRRGHHSSRSRNDATHDKLTADSDNPASLSLIACHPKGYCSS
jgi:hypothetical protein